MEECIICRLEKLSFSDEHVIPESLGGFYHIYSVCTKCNSKLGATVDSKLVNHTLSDFLRFHFRIKGKGKNGKIPNPFAGIYSIRNNPEKKFEIKLDSNFEIVPYLIPLIKQNKNEKSISFSISIDACDEKKLDTIIRKIANRNKIPYESILFQEKIYKDHAPPPFIFQPSIDLHYFKLGLLKIAYEFAVDSIPSYYNDAMAMDISITLFNANYDRSTEFIIGNGFEQNLKPLEYFLDFESKKHYLILASLEGGLVCVIKLYMAFSITVVLSEMKNHYLINEKLFLIGINDIENKSFRKLSMSELMIETRNPIYKKI